jgi:hypothetical protein
MTTLEPVVLTYNRISLKLDTVFPQKSNVALLDFNPNPSPSSTKEAEAPLDLDEAIRTSPYPNIEMSILDEGNQEVASVVVVEHRDPNLSLTLHIRHPQPGKRYTARAYLIYQQELIQTLTAPFTLPADATYTYNR